MVGNCRPLSPVPTESESSQGTDVTDAQFQNVLEKLSPYFSIDMNSLVNVKKEDGFISVCGTYRGVKTDLMVVDRLDPDPDTNGAFREMQARGGNPRNDDEMIFRTQFQYNEKQPWLDLITVKVQGRTAHVIIQEVFPDQRPAAELFDALAAECGASPFRPPMAKLTALVHGLLVLIRKLHQGGMAYGADPRRCLLSSLKNGHGKKAAAHVLDENGDPVALLLGNATHVQQNGFKFHDKSRTERSQQAQAVRSVHVTKRAKAVLKGALAASSGRSSQRLAAKEQNITWPDIILEHRVEVNSNIKELQAADIGRICNLMVNILKGSHGDNCNAWPAIPRSKDLIHIQLLKHCLEGNPGVTAESLREHCGCGPVADSQSLESSYTKLVFEKLNLQHQNLIHLLAYISANLKSDITAESVLGQPLFEGFEPPMSEYPHGLDSAPETKRGPLSECVPLMQAIDARVINYFVEGGTIDWRGREEKKLCTWLVYRWTEEEGWDRALFTAEKGKKGAIGAIYQNRLLSNLEADLVSTTHTLEVPCNRGCNWVGFDGLPRAVDAEQENMAKWTLLRQFRS